MKDTGEVPAFRDIHRSLTPDGGVERGCERRRDVYEIDPAHVRRRRETGEIGYRSAAEGDKERRAVDACSRHPRPHALDGAHVLGAPLPRRDDVLAADSREALPERIEMKARDVLVGRDKDRRVVADRRYLASQPGDEPASGDGAVRYITGPEDDLYRFRVAHAGPAVLTA